ncbi:hypothetical protein EMCG_02728 [[Emmonsia] crescens]|uniref:Major facilitator superfamily (MFS) profile domain-containing protein n=1 Tax=[Emmonsia] crescens TaxID=73230 RepID=A0A0G2HXP9_9EURO|nr:hypothetical protein EMCG_02728 [Emmonsia crescens UAMH 3008]
MKNHMAAGWFYSPSQMRRYFGSRISKAAKVWITRDNDIYTRLRNPYHIVRELNQHQWLMFLVGFLGWVWDAFDFFTVSLCITEIAGEFGVQNSNVSWGLTVTLMLRPVGALIFGLFADRYGRKWPMIINLGLFVVLELGSGFCNNLHQLLGVRSLYGIAMGGLYGSAAATALEDLPYEARGLISGWFGQGYAVGHLLTAIFYRAFVPTTIHGWRSLFWFGAAPPILIMIFRWYLPETSHFLAMKAEREARARADSSVEVGSKGKHIALRAFFRDGSRGLKDNWVLFVYMVVVMAGFSSCAHGSQDLYPTFLKEQVGKSPTTPIIITVVGQIGSIVGATTFGYLSTLFGRRLVMMIACIFGGALIPAYIFPRSNVLIASAFFEQFFVGGVWAPIPIHLSELTPPSLRGLMVGLTYQLGNLVSSASATIQSTIGERYPLPNSSTGMKRFDYGKVIAIFMGAVWAYMFILLFLGPEMTQEEREEEAEASIQLYQLQSQGINPVEVGEARARVPQKKAELGQAVKIAEKSEAGYIELNDLSGDVVAKV